MNSDIFEDHVQSRMPSLSHFTYSESAQFSEFYDISYIMVGLLQAKKHSNTAGPHYPGPDIDFCHTWSCGKSRCRAPGSAARPASYFWQAVLEGFFACTTPTIMYNISKILENWADSEYVKCERLGILDCTWSSKLSKFKFSTSFFHNVLYIVIFV